MKRCRSDSTRLPNLPIEIWNQIIPMLLRWQDLFAFHATCRSLRRGWCNGYYLRPLLELVSHRNAALYSPTQKAAYFENVVRLQEGADALGFVSILSKHLPVLEQFATRSLCVFTAHASTTPFFIRDLLNERNLSPPEPAQDRILPVPFRVVWRATLVILASRTGWFLCLHRDGRLVSSTDPGEIHTLDEICFALRAFPIEVVRARVRSAPDVDGRTV